MSTDPNPTPDPDPKPDPTPDPPKDYTAPASQADLDRIISERLARERDKFADYADLKKAKAEYDKTLQAAMTDQEKAVAAARKEGETAAQSAANVRLVKSEARALASEARFRNPSLAVQTIDLSDVTVNEDGEIDAEAVRAKLKALAESDPYMVDDGKKPKPKPDPAQGGGSKRKGGALTGLSGDDLYDRIHPKETPA